ncbi:hypothetical protein [uncultured Winogradskyella sp.]|uniref:hypothetical protein n=1 Tax=uncultured Winogradskyella sp. TaxID=395353 RepID=UPI00260BEA6D|nr:hypothetical protein [uncultured Winogradskyella sp.]
MTTFYNVCTRKEITSPSDKKMIYHKVGVVKVTNNGGWFLQLFQQPETDFLIFPNQNEQLPVINYESHDA